MSIIKLTAVMALIPIAANAAQVSTTQAFSGSDDLTTGLYIDNFLPTFDPALGTLTGVSVALTASLDWDETMDLDQPDGATSTFPLRSGVGLFDQAGSLWEIDAPASTWTATGPQFDFEQVVTIAGSISIDPTLFGDPEDLTIAPFGMVLLGDCIGSCSGDMIADDTFGEINGTLTTTFTFTPVDDPVPEPWSIAMLLPALAGLAAVRRA